MSKQLGKLHKLIQIRLRSELNQLHVLEQLIKQLVYLSSELRECQARQIESLSAKLEEVSGELVVERETVAIVKSSEADAKALLTKADEAQAKLVEDHAAELETAKKVHDSEVAAQAAEQLAATGTPPIENEPENHNGEQGSKGKMTPDDFWKAYNELSAKGDYEGKNAFYTEHKHVIGQ